MNKIKIDYRFCFSLNIVEKWWCLEIDVEDDCCCVDEFICLVGLFDCSVFFNIDGGDDGERCVTDDTCLLFVVGVDDEIVPLTRGTGGVDE